MAQSDIELRYLWDARDMYLNTVDDGSMQFEVWYTFESLTKFMFIDFNEIAVIGADLQEFREILKFVKYGKQK